MSKGVRTNTEQQQDPGFAAQAFYQFTKWLAVHPVAAGVLIFALLAWIFEGWIRFAAIACVLIVALLGLVLSDKLREYKNHVRLQYRWEGAPGRVGLAAELGLVPLTSRRVPRIKRTPTKQGFDVEIVCPPGLATSTVIEKSSEIGEALNAYEVTAEKVRGSSTVVVHCVLHDVLSENVDADWVVDSNSDSSDDAVIDSSSVMPPLSDEPYWEKPLRSSRKDDDDDGFA
ncbi:hypothetical protein [Corynebacterium casei]|uniref:hypothetical protein n=1 Tax=Corynebacterium casei TaxID=160386 RepID=UPI003BB6C09D